MTTQATGPAVMLTFEEMNRTIIKLNEKMIKISVYV